MDSPFQDFLASVLRQMVSINVYAFMIWGKSNYSSVLNISHVATIWNFDPNYSLPNVIQVSLPKKFQIVAT